MSSRSHTKVSQRTNADQFDLFSVVAPSQKNSDGKTCTQLTAQEQPAPAAAIRYVASTGAEKGRPPKPLRAAPVSSEPRLLDVREAARRLGLSKSTLDKMRCAGTGPRFIRATARAVRYDPADLDAFASARRRTSTMPEALSSLVGNS